MILVTYCYICGRQAQDVEGRAVCEQDGPLWLLQRNAPSASAIIVRDDSVLLTRRARRPWEGYWETPGGYVEWGEHPEDAIRRELHEELGAMVQTATLLGVYVEPWQPGDWHQTTLYEVRLATPDDSLSVNAQEVSEWGWFSPHKLPQMASTHERRISDWVTKGTSGSADTA